MSINIRDIETKKKENARSTSDVFNLAWLNRDIKLFGKKFNDKKKENFYSELGVLLSSGVDIKTSLEIIVNEQPKEADRALLNKIYLNIIKGDSLSHSMENTKIFSQYEVSSLKIGEESGRIDFVLNDLTKFYGKKIKQKRQLTNAFTYPIIVMLTAIAAVYFMLNFMVPMFVDVFNRFHGNLPSLTTFIINLSQFLSKYILYFLLFIISVTTYLYLNRKEKWFRSYSSTILLKMPILGKIVKLIYLERFFQSMTLLSSSKIPILKSVELIRNMIEFYPFEVALENAGKDIMFGKPLHESLAEYKFFDKRIISLIKVGEETNQLQFIFERLSKQYNDELEYSTGMISNLMEPIIIVFVGLLVGVILVAMYLPMFQMSTTIF